MLKFPLLLAPCLLLRSAADAAAQGPSAPDAAAVGAALDEHMRRLVPYGFNGVLLVVKDGRTLVRGGYGTADLESGRPFTPETPFYIGSLTKQFTAAGILRLEMEGRLRVTDSIGRFLPGVPQDKRGITLHHLLTHSAGLPGDPPGGVDGERDRDAAVREILDAPLRRATGSGYAYSNGGYVLLAAVIESAAGVPYEQYLREKLWEPAGMAALMVLKPGLAKPPASQDRAYGRCSRGFQPVVARRSQPTETPRIAITPSPVHPFTASPPLWPTRACRRHIAGCIPLSGNAPPHREDLTMKLRNALLLTLLLPAGALAAQDPEDPFLWLEEVEGSRSLEWVQAHNQTTLAELEAHPAYRPIYERTLQILNARERIAYPDVRGEWVYNFWQDEAKPRGVWRRTRWDSYLSPEPRWETVLDVDSLAQAESVPWSWGGATCLEPDDRLCLVRLSRGGADAVQVREFDAAERRFVQGGFFLPEGKQSVAWRGRDALLVARDFGEGTMTTSGYARSVRLWRRGTPLESATTLMEVPATDMGVWAGTFRTADRTWHVVFHRPAFFESTVHVLQGDRLVKLDLPLDADLYMVRDQMAVYLREPWQVGGRTHPAGSLIAMPMERFLAGERDFQMVVQPGERATITGVSATRDYLLVSMLNNVRGELRQYALRDGRWVGETVPAPGVGSVDVADTSPTSNRYFFTFAGFTQPTTLYLSDEGRVRELRRLPEMFNAANLVTEQFEATSKDGTRIPYFVVRRQGAVMDGNNPTLLYAYGGFEVAQTPSYSATTGAAWLERGGVYVLANIRGGGEFGPAWHRAGLKENRQRVFDDFIAVAEDLVARRITSPRRLGIMGGSNGGLLVGVALTQRPELFNAAVVQVPLLDMKRYSHLLAGASWMAEYGNPDVPEEWAYISRYSPYQNVRPGQRYPKVLFYTTTRDDRVHPGHARKMAARMEAMGYPVYYFENTEGGHGSGVTSEQRARMYAITYTYLLKRLAD